VVSNFQADNQQQLVHTQQDGIIPMAIGVGICFAMVSRCVWRVEHLLTKSDLGLFVAKTSDELDSPGHVGCCWRVERVSRRSCIWSSCTVYSPADGSATLVIMAVDQRAIASTPNLGDLFTPDTVSTHVGQYQDPG
jgi:hypothetical protein